MLIDWFTVAAQVANFLILVWLMRRFLYRPILDAIDAREIRIAAELADADAKKSEATSEREAYKKKNEAFEQQRSALLSKATNEAKAERQRLFDAARQAADALSANRLEAMQTEARNLQDAIRSRTQQEVFAISRKALSELAATSLEERMGEVFVRRLREMDDQSRAGFVDALTKASKPARIRSAFELPENQRSAIRDALNEFCSTEIRVEFEVVPELVAGIELSTDGRKIAWSIAEYLTSLEDGINELLKARSVPETKRR